MDADTKKKRRERSLSYRKERWSMDSQRFETIMTEIRNGYNNIRKDFDQVKVAEILEEIITEYAVEALQNGSELPKFTELAVLLQHCSELYEKKVDILYQQVLDICESITGAVSGGGENGESEEGAGGAEHTPGKRQRRRASGAPAEFTHIEIAPCTTSRRAPEPPRPPPTLPRMYIELEPRALAPHDRPLLDYDGEPLGLPSDYHVTRRLHDGFLVDELAAAGPAPGLAPLPAARPLSLLELQAAIEAAAAPEPRPLAVSTPLPADTPDSGVFEESLLCSPPPPPPPPPPDSTRKRKRRNSPARGSSLRLRMTAELRAYLSVRREFGVGGGWMSRVVGRRAGAVRAARAPRGAAAAEFRGFDLCAADAGGFPGWSGAEAAQARAHRSSMDASRLMSDSEDDGFYERSSFSGSDSSQRDEAERAAAASAAAAEKVTDDRTASPFIRFLEGTSEFLLEMRKDKIRVEITSRRQRLIYLLFTK